MAQSYVDTAGTYVLPGAYPKISVQANTAGLSTTGVLVLLGEADAGPDYTAESDLETNAYGPDELGLVIAKYVSGPIVDAFRAACSPSDALPGAFSRAIIVKTNVASRASGALGSYGTLYAKLAGKTGNLISYGVTAAQAEVVPTTGPFTFIPVVGTVNLDLRLNGGSALPVALVANTETPTTAQGKFDALVGVTATGGVDRASITVSGTLAVDANPSGAGTTVVQIDRSIAWATAPVVGDTLIIPAGSAIAGAGSANVGAYVVTAVTTTGVTAIKLSDADKPGAVIGVVTNPVDVAATAIAALTDVKAYSPVAISVDTGVVVDGLGKSLEIADAGSGTDLASRTAFALSTTAVTWISKSGSPVVLSGTEYKTLLTLARNSDAVSEELVAGGDIVLKVSYLGTSGTITFNRTAKTVSTTVAGGSGGSISARSYDDYPTIADFVTFLNSQTGYSASAGTSALGQLPLSAIDSGTYGIASVWGAQNGRIKADAYKFFNKVSESTVVQLGGSPAAALAGLPAVKSTAFLGSGMRGGTTSAGLLAAVDALENVRANFIVPLMSRDAIQDIADGLTDSSSDYTIDALNLAVKSHVLKMSTVKRKRNRQAFLSKRDTFANAKNAAGNLASSRVALAFQDFKQLDSTGNIKQFHPWMGATLAAAMQAAGFYRAIFFKPVNTAGVVSGLGDFNALNDSQVEDALLAGLLPARKALTGGFVFDSDQTTYSKDNNFVFNSIQAMYAADTIALSAAQQMEAAFVGQSTAEITAAIGLTYLEGIMAQNLRLKLIAPSDDAPKGFKNAKVKINGGAMIVEVEIKLAGALYFIPINFLVSAVTQTA